MMQDVDTEPDRTGAMTGAPTVMAAMIGAGIITAAGVLGVVTEDLAQPLIVPVSLAAAILGIVGFVWSYLRAVARSRVDEISVTQLYMVAGTVAPRAVKRRLQWSLWLQTAIAIAVMVVGFSRTDPEEFNWAACIIVAPLYGMGVNGIWVASHGSFGARIVTPAPRRRRRMPSASPGAPSSGRAARSPRAGRAPHPLAQARPAKPVRPSSDAGTDVSAGSSSESRTPAVGMEQNDEHG